MKKSILFVLCALFASSLSFGHLTGSKCIPCIFSPVAISLSAIAPDAITVMTLPPAEISPNSARLMGTVTSNGISADATFQYGLTMAYGSTATGEPSTVTGFSLVSAVISGLVPGTLYHFRAVGTVGGDPTYGNDLTFTTPVCPIGSAGSITGPNQVCQGGSGYIYSVPVIANANGYVWTVPTGGTITSGGVTNSITVKYSTVASSGLVKVYGTSACGNGTSSQLSVNVISPIVPILIGPSTVCANSAGNIYTTQAGMSNYVWTVSGGTITAGGSSTSYTAAITWTTAGTQSINVNFNNSSGCNATTPALKNVTVNPVPTPSITGPSACCTGISGQTYSTEPGMSGYTWNISAGGTITAGAGTNSITVTWNTAGAQSVYVNFYNPSGCKAPTPSEIHLMVNPVPVPAIAGPSAVCTGTTGLIYSTQPGMSGYTWALSAGGIITAGDGTASITVTWTMPGAQAVSVNCTNAFGCTSNAATVYPVTVHTLSTPLITGPDTLCIGASGNVYLTQAEMTNYIWTVSSGGTITSGGGTGDNFVAITWDSAATQTVTVNYNNIFGCASLAATSYTVTVIALPVPTITGPATTCLSSTGDVYVSQPGMTNYSWNISAGGVITAGGTPADNTVTVTWTSTGAKTVCVNFTNTTGCSGLASTCYFVTVSLALSPTISGITGMCVNSGNYDYITETGMTGYSWTVSAGGTINYGSGTSQIQVSWNQPGSQTVSVTYTNGNGCLYTTTILNITVNPMPVAAGNISGAAAVCGGEQGIAYSIAPVANAAAYIWMLPAGGTIASGAATNSITVNYDTNASSGNITVLGNNLCGNGPVSSDFPVTVNPVPPAPTITADGATLASSASTGNQWYFENAPVAGATGQIHIAQYSGDYWVFVTLNTCSSDTSDHEYVLMTGISPLISSQFQVYPVPNNGQFMVSMFSTEKDFLSIVMYNTLGEKIYEEHGVEIQGIVEKMFDIRPIREGVYSIIFQNHNLKVRRKIVISK